MLYYLHYLYCNNTSKLHVSETHFMRHSLKYNKTLSAFTVPPQNSRQNCRNYLTYPTPLFKFFLLTMEKCKMPHKFLGANVVLSNIFSPLVTENQIAQEEKLDLP